jgi:hypothetical protein
VFCYCIVALTTFVFVSHQSVAAANTSQQDEISLVCQPEFVLVNHDPDPFPTTLNPLIFEPAIPGGGVESSEDGTDYDQVSKLSCIVPPQVSLTLHAKTFVLSELKHSYERRPSISFVILYHCWKSFLA